MVPFLHQRQDAFDEAELLVLGQLMT